MSIKMVQVEADRPGLLCSPTPELPPGAPTWSRTGVITRTGGFLLCAKHIFGLCYLFVQSFEADHDANGCFQAEFSGHPLVDVHLQECDVVHLRSNGIRLRKRADDYLLLCKTGVQFFSFFLHIFEVW
jgi:hypothetical protein